MNEITWQAIGPLREVSAHFNSGRSSVTFYVTSGLSTSMFEGAFGFRPESIAMTPVSEHSRFKHQRRGFPLDRWQTVRAAVLAERAGRYSAFGPGDDA